MTDGLANSPGKLDGGEKTSGIQIVFPGLVNYADMAMFRRRGIKNSNIYLSFLQRRCIAFVPDTNDQTLW